MPKRIAVIGLGYFGEQLALLLAERGAEVLAVDCSMDRLDDVKDRVTQAICLDATERKALGSLGLEKFDAVVVGIGDDFEATLLTIGVLQDLRVPRIIARGTSPAHERILQHLGIREIIMPAVEAAERLSKTLMVEGVVDSVELPSDFTIMEMTAPDWMVGRRLNGMRLHEDYRVSLVTIIRDIERPALFGFGRKTVRTSVGIPDGTTEIERGDLLVVFGKEKDITRMARAPELPR
jgi:trk system potassium uptake protein TrkA